MQGLVQGSARQGVVAGSGRGSRPGFLPSLNGGRGIAAFLVFGGHFLALQFATPVGATQIYESGQRGPTDEFFYQVFNTLVPIPMDYFFVLSGFVLAWVYRPDRPAAEFWRRRFGKVYPVYFLTSLVAFVFFGVVADYWHSWKIILAHVFLLQAWTPDQSYLLGLNAVMWTLSAEAFLYLLFPALMLLLTRATKRGLQTAAVFCVAMSFLLPYAAGQTFTLREPAAPVLAPLEGFDNAFIYWFALMAPPLRVFHFTLGITLALLMRHSTRYAPPLWAAVLIFAGGLTATQLFLPVELRANAGMLVPVAVLIAAIAKSDLAGKRNPLQWRPLMFLGKISYCFYAVHILWILFTMVMIPVPSGAWDLPRLWLYKAGIIADPTQALPGWANIALFIAYLTAAITSAWLLYTLVEQPMLRLIRNRPTHTNTTSPPDTTPPTHLPEAPVSPAIPTLTHHQPTTTRHS
jgi:peptidoglycan/LPS O-acetylase OafA/YrhL